MTDAGTEPDLPRGDGVTAWRRIADGIEHDILAGQLQPGSRIPTEARLAERFGVNRHTVRRALADLTARGLVRTAQGRGTFVEAKALPYPIGPRTRFSEIVSRAGREALGELLGSTRETADPALAETLRVAPAAPVLRLSTRHRADGTPISIAQCHFPLPRFQGLGETFAREASLTRALAAHGVVDFTRAATRISARPASPEESRLLDLSRGRIVLVCDTLNVDQDGVPIQASRVLFAADRVELVVAT